MIKTTVTRNILIISLIMILILTAFSLELFATTTGDPVENPDFYKPNTATNTAQDSRITTRAGNILGIINVIGVVVSVITLMAIGVKYMFGSVEEKAEYKQTAMTYIIGAILIFSVTTIPNILYKIGTGLTSNI